MEASVLPSSSSLHASLQEDIAVPTSLPSSSFGTPIGQWGVLTSLQPYLLASIICHINIPVSFVSSIPDLCMSMPTLQFVQPSMPGLIVMMNKCRCKKEPLKELSHQLLLPFPSKDCPSHMEPTKWSWNPFIGEVESVEFEEAPLQSICNHKSIPTIESKNMPSPWYREQSQGMRIKSMIHWTSLLSPKKIWASFPSRPPNKSTLNKANTNKLILYHDKLFLHMDKGEYQDLKNGELELCQ